MSVRTLATTIVLMTCLAANAAGQAPLRVQRFGTSDRLPARVVAVAPSAQGSTTGMVAAGLGAGLVGFVVAGYIGARIADDPNSYEDLDALGGAIVGGTIGESLLLPVGVHLADHRKGSVLPAMLASLVIGVAGVSLAIASQDAAPLPGVILVLTPVSQLISAIAIERRTAR